ncbi:chymotrypsin-like protease CTRL-1 [Balaenoptera acutorostrata]|uniref:Chymotrypsin-like protease CTRL-1 n=1 Tax=Balaenoptera acutorostrata TaxID=9767 RepID=A0ABM3SKY2_BALAC|nr:chymotrypsin-like protease CTRL-1 [Balaenoptera acutorostrata]
MVRLRRSCHQTGAELPPEDCQWGECSAGLVALAGVLAGQQRLPLLRWFPHQPVLGGHCCPLQCCAITHPFWNPTTMNNDLMLLKLASPAQYTTRISPVCLPSSNEVLLEGLTCHRWLQPPQRCGVTLEARLSARRGTRGCSLVLSPGAPMTATCARLPRTLGLASSVPGSIIAYNGAHHRPSSHLSPIKTPGSVLLCVEESGSS